MSSLFRKSAKLPDDQVQEIIKATNNQFTKDDVQDRYKEFMKEFKDGKASKADFRKIFKDYFPFNSTATGDFSDSMFTLFDKNMDGTVDFAEYMQGIYMSMRADPRQKHEWAYTLYKGDAAENLTYANAKRLIKDMYDMMGVTAKHPAVFDEPEKLVNWMWKQLGKETNQPISFEEFERLIAARNSSANSTNPFREGESMYSALM